MRVVSSSAKSASSDKSKLLLVSLEEAFESLGLQYCASQQTFQDGNLPKLEAPGASNSLTKSKPGNHTRTSWVWVTTATSLPCSVSSRVVQTWVRRPRCTGGGRRDDRGSLLGS